jgi:hypothetical protein
MGTARGIRVEGDLAYVLLTQGYVAVIDSSDVHLVDGRLWHAQKGKTAVYAVSNTRTADGKRSLLPLHMALTGFGRTDHIDGDGLNNIRSNLRSATVAQNSHNQRRGRNNTSGFKGVHHEAQTGRWRACIRLNGKLHRLGRFETPEDAHKAYCKASVEMHGEFGRAV